MTAFTASMMLLVYEFSTLGRSGSWRTDFAVAASTLGTVRLADQMNLAANERGASAGDTKDSSFESAKREANVGHSQGREAAEAHLNKP
ncbi:hypothetical protein AB0P17_05490 [Streptomyces sp. NPDC088124]|uniref:hypothetical protein n=1 Tax=Streptomyces sp. NPDC088124 TaxID=3154654 RepID=UPI00343230C0